MSANAFDVDAPLNERRIVIRRSAGDVEMVKLPWGLQPRERGGRPITVVRAEGRSFPDHRCLVPASGADGDWFYFAGIWRPGTADWPESYAIVTTEANPEVAPYHDRQMTVLRRENRMAWLDMTTPEVALLRPLPTGSYTVSRSDCDR